MEEHITRPHLTQVVKQPTAGSNSFCGIEQLGRRLFGAIATSYFVQRGQRTISPGIIQIPLRANALRIGFLFSTEKHEVVYETSAQRYLAKIQCCGWGRFSTESLRMRSHSGVSVSACYVDVESDGDKSVTIANSKLMNLNRQRRNSVDPVLSACLRR